MTINQWNNLCRSEVVTMYTTPGRYMMQWIEVS